MEPPWCARTHPLTPRGPAPLRLSVARAGTPSAIPIGRAPRALPASSLSRGSQEPGVAEGVRAPERTTSTPPRRGGRARERGGRCPPELGHRPAAAGAHGSRPRGWSAAAGPGLGVRAPSAASPLPPRPPSHLPSCGQVCGGRWGGTPGASSSAPAWGACGTRSSSAGPRGGAARAGRPGVRPAGREAAPFVRVTEPCLRRVQLPRRRRRGTGCDHLGGRRPLPRRRGGISLKEAGTSLFPGRGRGESGAPCPARGGRGGGARTWPLPPAQALPGGGPRGSPDPACARRRPAVRGGRGRDGPRRQPFSLGPNDSGLSDPGRQSPDSQPGTVNDSETRTNPLFS